jgi:hypothetical protein
MSAAPARGERRSAPARGVLRRLWGEPDGRHLTFALHAAVLRFLLGAVGQPLHLLLGTWVPSMALVNTMFTAWLGLTLGRVYGGSPVATWGKAVVLCLVTLVTVFLSIGAGMTRVFVMWR